MANRVEDIEQVVEREREPSEPELVVVGDPDDDLLLFGTQLPTSTRLVGFRGVEQISTPYRFEVAFSLPAETELDMRSVVGSRIALGMREGESWAPTHHGIVASLELLEAVKQRAVYLAVMVPELWHLSHSVHSRIYTDVTLPQIIEAVLKHGSVSDFDLRLSADYESREHVCQYRESDLDFISRHMERDGLYYFFEHGNEREKLVIVDDVQAHRSSLPKPVRYTVWDDDAGDGGAGLSRFRCRISALPAKVQLTDYDPLRPALPVRGEAAVSVGRGDVVLYGEHLRSPGDGARLARIRAQELLARQDVFDGVGGQRGLGAGRRFELEEHPRGDFNRAYFATEVRHYGKAMAGVKSVEELLDLPDESYRCELRAISADVQYRAPRVTAWPRIDGVMDGVVDASGSSEYAPVDEHGRYRVRMFFDESDLVDGSRSTWVRMLQPHGGGVEGMHFPLRKGTEVHMLFLGGDPDRPVIVGTAPNAHKPSKVTQGNMTQNVLRSGAANELVMDDAGGAEYVTMATPHLGSFVHMGAGADNFVTSTEGNGREHVGGNRVGTIGGSFDETVTGPVTQAFNATMDQRVAGPATQSYDATLAQSVTGPVTQTFAATHALDVSGDATHNYQSNVAAAVNGTLTRSVQGATTLSYAATVDESITGAYSLTVDAVTTEAHNADKSTTISGEHWVSASGSQTIEGLGGQTMYGPSQTFTADGDQILQSSNHTVTTTNATTQASSILLEAGASATVQAADVGISAGTVGVDGGEVNVNGGGAVTVTGGGVLISAGGMVEVTAAVIKLN